MTRHALRTFAVATFSLAALASLAPPQAVANTPPADFDQQTLICSNPKTSTRCSTCPTCPTNPKIIRACEIGSPDTQSLSAGGSFLDVLLMQMQGEAFCNDGGCDGLGSLPGGCGSCGAGGNIPSSSQLPRTEWIRVWRSTFTHDGSFGTHQYHTYDYYVIKWGNYIEFRDPNTGYCERFIKQNGVYNPTSGVKFRATVTEATGTHITIRQPGGRKLRFELTGYTTSGGVFTHARVESTEDIRGNKITFTYVKPATDTTADVKKWDKITDAYGRVTTMTYIVWNTRNVIEKVTLPGGRTIDYTYDVAQNQRFVNKVTYGGGYESTWKYQGATVTINDATLSPRHANWSALLNNAATGRIRHIKRADGNYFLSRYDESVNGEITSHIWNRGLVSEVVRSSTKQLISRRMQKLDGTWDSDLDFTVGGNYLPQTANELPADGIGPNAVPARTYSVERDALTDKITKRILPDGTDEEYLYNSFNQVTEFVDRRGDITQNVYDANGNILTRTVAVGTLEEADAHWTYNAQGQVLTAEDYNGNVTTYQYYAAGHASQFELEKTILPSGPGQPAGEITYTYTAYGRVKTVTDPVGRTVTYDYDEMGRLVKTTYDDTSTEETVYDTGANSARVTKTLDRNGNETHFTYDATGRVLTTTVKEAVTLAIMTQTTRTYEPITGLLVATETDGDVTEIEYDYKNRVTKRTVYPKAGQPLVTENVYNRYRLDHSIDAYGRKTTYTYDVLNRVIETERELRPGGATIVTKTEYDDDGNVVASIDANDNETEMTYDARDRRVTTTHAANSPVQSTSSVEYDDNSNVTRRIDQRNHDWLTTYTVRNRPLTEANPEGDTSSTTYTADTLVAVSTNANGHTSTNVYEPCCARLESVTDQDGNATSFSYDFNGNRISSTDASGRVVTLEFDGLNRQTKQTVDPAGLNLVSTTSYDPTLGVIGKSTTSANPAGQTVTSQVDGMGRSSIVSGDTVKRTYDYDTVIVGGPDDGLLETASHIDPDNKNLTSSQLSDGAGRTVEATDPLGKIVTMTYDDQSNLLTATDQDGLVTTNTYDAKNRLKTNEGDTGGIAAVTTTEYDDTNNRVKITDAEGKVTVYAYDDANRKLTTTYASGTPDATVWTKSYLPLGQVDTITKPNGITIEHTYENRELLASKVYKQGAVVLGTDTFTYHPNRLLATSHGGLYNTDIDRSVINTSYDKANRMIQDQCDIGAGLKTLGYQYTPDSRMSQTTYPGGTQVQKTYNAHRLPLESKIGGITQATNSYDTADRKTGRACVNGTSTAWTLDEKSRVTKLRHYTTGTGVLFQEWDYRYTDADDPEVQDDVTPGFGVHGEAYLYDGLHRLETFDRGQVAGVTILAPVQTQNWTLSKAGDWTEWDDNGVVDVRSHNDYHAVTGRSVVPNPITFDANMNQTDDGKKYLYEWDANDKLKKVLDRVTLATVAEYRYDSQGRRIEKKVGKVITRYYCSGQQVVEERDGNDVVVATYTYGDYVDETCTMDRGGQRYYYHCNRMFSTYALTNAKGNVVERYDYTAYGAATTFDAFYGNLMNVSRVGNPYMFTGRRLDDETLLYFYRARPYNAEQGRFISKDPLGFSGSPWNLYEYVGGRPTVAMDPSGLMGTGTTFMLLPNFFVGPIPKKCCVGNSPFGMQAAQWQYTPLLAGTVYTGVMVHLEFLVAAHFVKGSTLDADGKCCACTCCEFRQEVRGVMTIDGKNVGPGLPGGNKLDPKVFNVDGVLDPTDGKTWHIPGDRDDTGWKEHRYFSPDWENGCEFGTRDRPSVKVRPGETVVLRLEFRFVIRDRCNGNKEIASRTVPLPNVKFKAPLTSPIVGK